VDAHGLPAPAARAARWAVPIAEAIVPLLVLLGRPRAAGAWSLVLLAGFSLELIRIRRGGRVPCGCFGARRTVPASTALLRNGALAAAAVLVVALGEPSSALRGPGAPGAGDAVPFVLAAGSVVAAAAVAWRAIAWLAPRPVGAEGDASGTGRWGSA
jgi:hypothetical protein